MYFNIGHETTSTATPEMKISKNIKNVTHFNAKYIEPFWGCLLTLTYE